MLAQGGHRLRFFFFPLRDFSGYEWAKRKEEGGGEEAIMALMV